MTVKQQIEKAVQRIAPAWELKNSVAVNPYLGFSDTSFEKAAEVLSYRGGIALYMPIDFYLKAFEKEEITANTLQKILDEKNKKITVTDFITQAREAKSKNKNQFQTFVKFVEAETGKGLKRVMELQLSDWLGAYFNENDAKKSNLFSFWKRDAQIDLFSELSGVKHFRKSIKKLPDTPEKTILWGLEKLQIPLKLTETYLHSLLLELIGWSSYCAGFDFQNKLYGGDTCFLSHLLAILVAWETAILNSGENLQGAWKKNLTLQEAFLTAEKNDDLKTQEIFQNAFDRDFKQKLIVKFNGQTTATKPIQKERAQAQIVFCIDVRSEVYRRNLEAVNDRIETIGFAGFFGFALQYKPINHKNAKNQCPVLIASSVAVLETPLKKQLNHAEKQTQNKAKFQTSWAKFKKGSVSCYGFVSPLGIFYLPKLISDAFGWTQPLKSPKSVEFGKILNGHTKLDISKIPFENRVAMATSALSTMGLTKDFAPLVLITGHGASSINNPHASGLDCGACGGNSGEINAIAAQLILNDKKVRTALEKEGIIIPQDTSFIACLHNTTTDEIRFLDEKNLPKSHYGKITELKKSLDLASKMCRKTRAPRLNIEKKSVDSAILKRANDWAQVRPEWGLSGCSSFIIAPRNRTKNINLEGKAFLHSYDWQSDSEFKILEAIMTAPMVVTTWINLQYYASTVDNKHMGAGNKTLHNATAGIGVVEGAKGDLKIGLPLQSIYDGENYQHLPIRLNVVIEAPEFAIQKIIKKHKILQQLFDNKWISLLIINESGKIAK